jgi:hypothetical protein
MSDENVDILIDETPPESASPVEVDAGKNDSTAQKDPRIAAVDELKEQFEALKVKSEAVQRERTEALRRASEAEETAHRTQQDARKNVLDSRLSSLETGISAAEAEAQSAEEAWAAAMSSGDYAAAARAQRRMQRAENNLTRLEDAKGDLEGSRQNRMAQPPPADPVEAFIQGRTARTASWLRAHSDHIIDPAKNRAMERAHHSALGAGFEPDTDEYFSHVEERLGLREKPSTVGGASKSSPAAPPVAPVNSGGSATPGNAIKVDLNEHERRAATDGTHTWNFDDPKGRFKKGEPIGLKEFARRKYLMRKDGAYDRNMGE